MISFQGRHFPKDLILMAVRWKLAYPLSYRNIEYLKHAEGQYKLNLFLCKESISGVSEELSAKPPVTETTEYSLIPFFKSTEQKNCLYSKVLARQLKPLNSCNTI